MPDDAMTTGAAAHPVDGIAVIVFDVNETLSDMSPIAGRFTDLGAPAHLAPLWFACVLRDGFALAAAGTMERFAVLGAAALRTLLADVPIDRDVDSAVAHVLEGFAGLPVHPDVPGGARALASAGRRLVTFSNGSAEVAEGLLARAGVRDRFAACLSVEDAGAWKPAAAAYAYAAGACRVAPSRALMVAVHPWDIDGAARAGMRTAWIDRGTGAYPGHLRPPDLVASGLDDLALRLAPGVGPARDAETA